MDEDILKADRSLRIKLFYFIILITIVGVIAKIWGIPLLFDYLKNSKLEKAALIIEITLDLLFLGLIPFSIYFFRLAIKTLKYNCFPPPGIKVVSDTPIVRGSKAKIRGIALLLFSIILTGIMVFLIFQTHYVMKALFRK